MSVQLGQRFQILDRTRRRRDLEHQAIQRIEQLSPLDGKRADCGDRQDLDQGTKPGQVGPYLPSPMTEAAQLSSDRFDGGCDLRIDSPRCVEGPADPHWFRLPLRRRKKWLDDLGPVRVARQVAGHRVEAQRRICHRSGDDTGGGEPRPVFAQQGTARDASTRRLQANQAAA